MSAVAFIGLVVWGTLVGIDLVSVSQMMIARPLVAATVSGLLLGDPDTGLRVGVVLELFQFDVLPVGAVRYPEYGPAAIAAVVLAHGMGGSAAVGVAVGFALLLAIFGGTSLHWLRTANSRAVHAATPALEAGDARVLARVHAGALVRDLVRAALVTMLGLGLAWVALRLGIASLPTSVLVATTLAAGGAALATGGIGLLRLVGRGPRLRWLAVGLVVGGVAVWIV